MLKVIQLAFITCDMCGRFEQSIVNSKEDAKKIFKNKYGYSINPDRSTRCQFCKHKMLKKRTKLDKNLKLL